MEGGALEAVERYRAAQPVHSDSQAPLPLVGGVGVAEPPGERGHGVRQAQHQHDDDGDRRLVRRIASLREGVGAPAAGEPDPAVLADDQLQERPLPAGALLAL